MLSRAGLTGRIVIVGYSLSGLHARLYADRYLHQIAGMVLVAPNIPYQNQWLARAVPALKSQLSIMPWMQHCVAAAEHHEIHPGAPAYAQCMYTPPDRAIPGELLDVIHQQWERPGLWRSVASSARESDKSSAEVRREQRPYGLMPLVVLTTTKDIESLPIPISKKKAVVESWIFENKKIARLSALGVDMIINGSTQAIPIDRPAAVISAINAVVDRVRRTPDRRR